jgi:hypothetical protein
VIANIGANLIVICEQHLKDKDVVRRRHHRV